MTLHKKVDIADIIETQDNKLFSYSIVGLCCLVLMADGFDNQALNYTSPAIIREWGIDRETMVFAFTSSTVGWMSGALIFSIIADAIGRRNATVLAAFFFGGATFAISFAEDLWQLSILRFLSSFGVGGAMPMAIALISDYTPSKRRGTMITMLFLGYTVGSSGGGFLAAELILTLGWQSVFMIGGIAAMAIGVLLLFALPESVRYLLVQNAPQEKIHSLVRRMKPGANYSADTEFVINEQKKPKGLPASYLFRDGRAAMTTFLWLALAFSFVTHFFISNWLPVLLADYMELDQVARTKAFFQFGAFFGIVFGWLIDRYGVPVVIWAKCLGAIPVAAIGLFLVGGAGPYLLMGIALGAGIFVLGGTIGLNAITGMVYPTFIRSTGTGAAFFVARFGALMGPALGATLLAYDVPIVWIFIIGALPMLLSGISAFFLSMNVDVLHKRKPPHAEHSDEPAVEGGAAPARA